MIQYDMSCHFPSNSTKMFVTIVVHSRYYHEQKERETEVGIGKECSFRREAYFLNKNLAK